MSDLQGLQPDVVECGDHKIVFIKYSSIKDYYLTAAIVVVVPPLIGNNEVPDVSLGFGNTEAEAKADAFKVAKSHIKNHSPKDG